MVDGLLCKLSFKLLSHYICILSQLMHLSTSIMAFNNIIPRVLGGGGGGASRGESGLLLCDHVLLASI